MKKLFVFLFALTVTSPAYALFGVGDLTYDPQTFAETAKMVEQAKQMYQTMKQQLDTISQMEQTIHEAQQAYDTLGNTHFRDMVQGLKPDGSNTQTAAGLRASLADMEAKGAQASGFVNFQMSRIKNLENLELLQTASQQNAADATGKMNQATAERITAQSSAALASLAAAEEQRHVQEDIARANAAKSIQDNLNNSGKVYNAIGGQ